MQRIKRDELPEVLTDEIVEILARMADEIPQSQEWQDIFSVLSNTDYRKVMDKKSELQRQEEKERINVLSDEEKATEEAKWKKMSENTDPTAFYGNMGQPTTLEEYKNRYGAYPPGYDRNGKKV